MFTFLLVVFIVFLKEIPEKEYPENNENNKQLDKNDNPYSFAPP
jgi:hypothetical protein